MKMIFTYPSVYYSSYNGISAGDKLEYEGDISVASIRKTYDYGLFDFYGYTVLNNFTNDFNFQIILLIPANYVNYEINRLSVVYGGYSALMIILSVLIVILFTSMFSRRIKLLSEKMHSVASGNFDVEFDDRGNDEIADLYTDLGQMIKSMQSMMNDIYQAKLQSEAFKFNQMEAEFKALSSQINPHFLFNSLNTLYGMIVSRSEKAEEAFVKFTDMLKYMYDNPTAEKISLEKEMEYIDNYVEFQELRHNGHTKVEWVCSIENPTLLIPPMLLITFVENAFKYGSSSSRDCTISIRASEHDGRLLFETENRIMKRPSESQKGIGLENCRNRLELLYPGRYELSISENEDIYKVRLMIEL